MTYVSDARGGGVRKSVHNQGQLRNSCVLFLVFLFLSTEVKGPGLNNPSPPLIFLSGPLSLRIKGRVLYVTVSTMKFPVNFSFYFVENELNNEPEVSFFV